MAKTAYHEVPGDMIPGDVILEIKDLIANHDGTFTLRGVNLVEVNHKHFEAIEQALIGQGVQQNLALRLIEEAHAAIHTGLLADAFAQRTRRVG